MYRGYCFARGEADGCAFARDFKQLVLVHAKYVLCDWIHRDGERIWGPPVPCAGFFNGMTSTYIGQPLTSLDDPDPWSQRGGRYKQQVSLIGRNIEITDERDVPDHAFGALCDRLLFPAEAMAWCAWDFGIEQRRAQVLSNFGIYDADAMSDTYIPMSFGLRQRLRVQYQRRF